MCLQGATQAEDGRLHDAAAQVHPQASLFQVVRPWTRNPRARLQLDGGRDAFAARGVRGAGHAQGPDHPGGAGAASGRHLQAGPVHAVRLQVLHRRRPDLPRRLLPGAPGHPVRPLPLLPRAARHLSVVRRADPRQLGRGGRRRRRRNVLGAAALPVHWRRRPQGRRRGPGAAAAAGRRAGHAQPPGAGPALPAGHRRLRGHGACLQLGERGRLPSPVQQFRVRLSAQTRA